LETVNILKLSRKCNTKVNPTYRYWRFPNFNTRFRIQLVTFWNNFFKFI